jgi:hypothetical protein
VIVKSPFRFWLAISDDGLAVRRREAMPPVPRIRHADALNPVDLLPAG